MSIVNDKWWQGLLHNTDVWSEIAFNQKHVDYYLFSHNTMLAKSKGFAE